MRQCACYPCLMHPRRSRFPLSRLLSSRSLLAWLLCLPMLAVAAVDNPEQYGGESFTITLGEDTEITGRHFPTNDGPTVLWIASGYGLHPRHYRVARALAAQGMDVWLADLLESLFMPPGTTSIRSLDGHYVAQLATQLCRRRGQPVTLISGSYGAIPVLRGARLLQRNSRNCLAGAILFSPNFLARVPGLGEEPEFLPIIDATNIPLVIFQAEKNSNRGQSQQVLARLQRAGATVWVRPMTGVTALFYDGDTTAATRTTLRQVPQQMRTLLELLARTPIPAPRPAPNIAPRTTGTPVPGGLDHRLRPYHGRPEPWPLDLKTAGGQRVRISDYRGQVTVVNFWASWCPPCVEEIPSLNRLKEKFTGRPFRLISINYGESPQQIRRFLKKVDVRFPVLLDEDGRVARQWKVVAFPSTFVIDTAGRIRYGVNAAIHWDDPAVTETLEALLTAE
ncbi:MAG TPA: redoxin domain-containing protein [Gammaproteobacteria bacterium]|nr:redoxin domain-containing protein [Gammaproteobacteria bacterium]